MSIYNNRHYVAYKLYGHLKMSHEIGHIQRPPFHEHYAALLTGLIFFVIALKDNKKGGGNS